MLPKPPVLFRTGPRDKQDSIPLMHYYFPLILIQGMLSPSAHTQCVCVCIVLYTYLFSLAKFLIVIGAQPDFRISESQIHGQGFVNLFYRKLSYDNLHFVFWSMFLLIDFSQQVKPGRSLSFLHFLPILGF